jgi:hypothetical protein
MQRHMLPNVMHLVLITTVLEFSGLILYEAVLSYVGVGVDPMNSFGGMINLARVEMSRDPMVWWSFLPRPLCSWWPWCWRPTCLPMACATPSIRAPASIAPAPVRPFTQPEVPMLQTHDLHVTLDAEAGLVRAIDGLSLTWSAAKPSHWSGSRAAARA